MRDNILTQKKQCHKNHSICRPLSQSLDHLHRVGTYTNETLSQSRSAPLSQKSCASFLTGISKMLEFGSMGSRCACATHLTPMYEFHAPMCVD